MAKPWTLIKVWTAFLLSLVILVPGITLATPFLPDHVQEKQLWPQAQALADRLQEERRKIDGLTSELEKLRFISEDLRDLQLYSPSVTHLSSKEEAALDKRIETLERHALETERKIREVSDPLSDAVFITGEMVKEALNHDMLDILSRDNVERVSKLIALQREIDTRWQEASEVLNSYRDKSGLADLRSRGERIDEDFFRVLQLSVGLSSSRFYDSFHNFKDALVNRANANERERMARIDLDRLQKRYAARSLDRVQEDLERLVNRFRGKMPIGVIEHGLAQSYLAGGRPLDAAHVYLGIAADSKKYEAARLGLLQAYFAAHADDSVAYWYRHDLEAGVLHGPNLASARYLAVQSLYALGRDSLVEREALHSTSADAWNAKVLLVYARALVRMDRHAEARKVFARLMGDARQPLDFKNQAAMAQAHLNFEDHYHEAALKGYRELIDQTKVQAEALYGMVWCNIRLGDLDGAEFVLKKLIAQHPDDPWAMEGFMVLVRKMLRKAQEEWAWRQQITNQRDRLRELSLQVRDRESELGAKEVARLLGRIHAADDALEKQPAVPVETVAALYQQALGLCDFLESRYRTGEYSDLTFKGDREKVLKRLADAATPFQGDTAFVLDEKPDRRKDILNKLFEARSLALDIHILHRAWLEDVLRQWQLKLRRQIDTLGNDAPGILKRRELEKQSKTLADDISERIAAKGDDILQRIETLAEDPNSIKIRDWLLFQRGYLMYTREEENLRRSMAAQRWVKSSGGGAAEDEDDEPEIAYQSYEAPWLELLKQQPNSKWAPAVLYYLGYSMTARGEAIRGLNYFELLAQNYPDSKYAQQALIFIGEHYFNDNHLDKAEAAYDQVLNHPDSRYFDQALYKLAWTRYRKSAYKSAISSFSYILGENSGKQDARKNLLAGEALQYTALSLAEADTSGDGGWQQGMQFADKMGDSKVGADLLHKMALIYLQQGRLDRARRSLETLLSAYPYYEKAPDVLLDLARAYDKGQDFEHGAETRERFFRTWLPGTVAYQKLSSNASRQATDSALVQALEMATRHHLLEAKKLAADSSADGKASREQHYRKALAMYEQWINAYPDDKQKVRKVYQQAEIQFAIGDYGEAAKKYMMVSRTEKGELRMTAAYNAIVAAQELLKRSEHANE